MSLMFLSNVAAAVASISVFQDSGKVNYVIQVILSPSLNITKSVSPTTYSAVGQNITYTYTITNSGNVDLTGNITVADNKTGTFNITSNGLNVGKNVTGTANYTIHQSDIDAGYVTNSANATCSFSNELYTSKDITARINITQNPVLTLVKLASPTTYSSVGQNITYTYTVTNYENLNFKGNITVTDNKTGTFNISNVDIAPGQNITGISNYTITQPDLDAGSVINIAYVLGVFNISNPDLAPVQNVKGPSNYTITQPDLDVGSMTNTVYATHNIINSNYAISMVKFIIFPLANFSANVTSGYAPLSVKFTDLSTNVIEWNWSFGDGAYSNQSNTIHTFAAENYTVNETVSNTNGRYSKIAKIYVLKTSIPTITWSNPADIVYGTPLNSTQLDANASVPGTFEYIPQSGTLLNVGVQQTLDSTFTPKDSVNL